MKNLNLLIVGLLVLILASSCKATFSAPEILQDDKNRNELYNNIISDQQKFEELLEVASANESAKKTLMQHHMQMMEAGKMKAVMEKNPEMKDKMQAHMGKMMEKPEMKEKMIKMMQEDPEMKKEMMHQMMHEMENDLEFRQKMMEKMMKKMKDNPEMMKDMMEKMHDDPEMMKKMNEHMDKSKDKSGKE